MEECFGCGARYSGHDHKCDQKREDRIENARRSVTEGVEVRPSYFARLRDGFWMWKQAERMR